MGKKMTNAWAPLAALLVGALALMSLLVVRACRVRAARDGAAEARMLSGGLFPKDDLKAAEALAALAAHGDADLVPSARAWAGTNVTRRFWVCDVARNAGRTNELAVLARDAAEACSEGDATFARLLRAAKFLEECRDVAFAREVLARAAPLAATRTEREDLSFAMLRIDLADDGASPARLEELRRIASGAVMNDNRRAAARLLKAYER